jgi:hypothetical protein
MATDQQKCEALVGELAFIGEQDIYQSTITIYSSGQAILVGRTTHGIAKKVNFEGLPALRAALKSRAQYGFGHPLNRDGIRWEFRQGRFRFDCLGSMVNILFSTYPRKSIFKLFFVR